MRRDEITELHFITATSNLESILARGILSHRQAARLQHVSVAMEEVQDLRRVVVVPGGRPLHDYANLYMNARNTMMYKLRCYADCPELCVVRVSPSVLDIKGVVIADKNAASGRAAFRPVATGLRPLATDRIFAISWNHDDPIDKIRHKQEMCAEVLVPDRVPPNHLMGAYVRTPECLERLQGEITGFDFLVNRAIFF